MSKTDKADGIASIAEARRTPVPDPRPGKVGKGRGRNFDAADASLRDRVAKAGANSWLAGLLPENEGATKAKMRELRAKKCECGHRGDKHFSRWWFRRGIEARPCTACGGSCEAFKEETPA